MVFTVFTNKDWCLETNMAGFSNPKFLIPSHFTKTDENIAAKTTKDSERPVLLPPSSYEKIATSNKPNEGRKKFTCSVKSRGSDSMLPGQGHGEKENKQSTNRETFLNNELQKAKRKICELEQEKAILEDDLQDRQALAEVVWQLKNDLKKSKEKLKVKEMCVSGKTEEYLDVINSLRSDLQEAEHQYLSLKQSYSKLVEDIRLTDETNGYLKRKIEAKDLEFECMVHVKEQEMIEMEEKYKKLEENKRKVEEEHERILRDKVKIKEEYNTLKVEKDRMEGNLSRMEDDKWKILGDMERMKGDMIRLEQDKIREEEKNCRIKQDSTGIREENKRLIKSSEENEENIKRIEKEFLDEQEKCLKLQSEIQEKVLVISELKDSIKTRQDELCRVELEYKGRVEELKKEFQLKHSQLEDEIHSKDHLLHKETQMYQETLLKKDEEINALSKSIEQLRSYIGDVRPNQEAKKLNEANKQLTDNIQILTNENNTLHSTTKLLNVRLSAILEIVSIQEAELTRHRGVTGVDGGNEGLLRTWREKVFALMVQLQSLKISENETKRKEDIKISDLNSQLQELERGNSILNHKLADQEAATELEMKKRTALQQENEKLRNENTVFKKKEDEWSTHFQTLQISTKDVEKTLLQSLTNLSKTVSKLTSFDERLKFAGSRIQFISEFLAHRGLQQRSKLSVEDSKDVEIIPDESTRENEEHLKSEVERLLKERAVLLNETKQHNHTLQEKTSALQQQYENIIAEKNTQIGKLEVSESEKKERLHSLQDELETKCEELEEALETIKELKLSLSKEKTTIEKEHREMVETERLRNAEDLSVIETQLNDIRREHAKAVAALKSAERQVNREKQQAANMVANIEREYSEKLERCEKQLKSVEKEKNLLMVRIREDRSRVVRSQPVIGRDNSTKKSPLLKTVKTSIPKQSLDQNRTQENVMDHEEPERTRPIDAEEALTALKEIRVLSQQIVKLHDKNNDLSTSESEL